LKQPRSRQTRNRPATPSSSPKSGRMWAPPRSNKLRLTHHPPRRSRDVLVVLARAMGDDAGWPLGAVLSSTVGVFGLIRIAVALAGAAIARTLRRHPYSTTLGALLVSGGALLALTGALASHAVGRIDGGVWLVFIGALHQAAAATWVGGLVCAAVLALRSPPAAPETWLRPFSRLVSEQNTQSSSRVTIIAPDARKAP